MTSLPPKCSARVTTPSGIDIHALIRGAAFGSAGSRSIRTSSVDPPPMSNRMAPRPFGSSSGEQPMHGERGLGLAVDHLQPDAGLGRDAVAKTGGVGGRAAGFGRDQPQPLGLPGLDLVAANAQRRDRALDRGVADAAGRRDSLAQPDDPRERIDHAKAVAGGTGDQEPAIIGAKVERGIDAGSRSRRMAVPGSARRLTATGRSCGLPRGPRPSRSRVSSFIKMSFRGQSRPARNFRSRKL